MTRRRWSPWMTIGHKHMRSYIYKPIDFYEQLRVICVDDYTRGTECASIYWNSPTYPVVLEADDASQTQDIDVITPVNEHPPIGTPGSANGTPTTSMSSRRTQTRSKKRKRGCDDRNDQFVESIYAAMKEIAISIKEASQIHEHWTSQLSRAVIKVPGFGEDSFTTVLDDLLLDEAKARAFIVRPPRQQVKWIVKMLGTPTEQCDTPSAASGFGG